MTMHFDARDFARNVLPLGSPPLLPRSLALSSLVLRDERFSDEAARETLLDACFGAERFGKTCERLREGRLASRGLSFAAVDDGALVGTLRLWDIEAGGANGASVRALMLGPLAVAKSHQSLGLGGAMIRKALARATQLRHGAVILVGDAPYYQKFGFERRLTESLQMPGWVDESRFLGLELQAGALNTASGLVRATGRLVSAPQLRAA